MFEKVPFHRKHVEQMLLQPANAAYKEFYGGINYEMLESIGSVTGLLNGKPAVCGGVVPYWEGRAYAWTMFDESNKKCFIPVFRGIKKFLNEMRPLYNRIEIAVPVNFHLGIRRALLLGFEMEVECAKKYTPDGADCSILVLFGGAKWQA